MFTPEQYRAQAVEYSRLVKIAKSPTEVREFQRLEHTFTELADNAQWAVDNHDKSLHATSGSTGTSKSKGRKPCSVGASNSWSPRCVVLAGFKRAHG
jgi:hypothetical protein